MIVEVCGEMGGLGKVGYGAWELVPGVFGSDPCGSLLGLECVWWFSLDRSITWRNVFARRLALASTSAAGGSREVESISMLAQAPRRM